MILPSISTVVFHGPFPAVQQLQNNWLVEQRSNAAVVLAVAVVLAGLGVVLKF